MKISSHWFDVFFGRKPLGQKGCLDIAISKKVIKLAVDRNKIKRQVKTITKELASDLLSRCNIRVIAKTSGRSFGDIKSDLSAAFQAARRRIISQNREIWSPKEAKPLG